MIRLHCWSISILRYIVLIRGQNAHAERPESCAITIARSRFAHINEPFEMRHLQAPALGPVQLKLPESSCQIGTCRSVSLSLKKATA